MFNKDLEELKNKQRWTANEMKNTVEVLGSFNGSEPGGPESTIRKWKREPEGGRERERERKKDMGTQALMEQRCFNDLSVIIYRLWYKKFLSTMIKIRKPNVWQLLPREQGINNGHKVRRQSTSQERGSRLSSFVIRRMFTEGDSSLSHPMILVLGAACRSTSFWQQKLIRNRGFMRNSA